MKKLTRRSKKQAKQPPHGRQRHQPPVIPHRIPHQSQLVHGRESRHKDVAHAAGRHRRRLDDVVLSGAEASPTAPAAEVEEGNTVFQDCESGY